MDARTMLRIARALVASGRGEEAERIVGAMERSAQGLLGRANDAAYGYLNRSVPGYGQMAASAQQLGQAIGRDVRGFDQDVLGGQMNPLIPLVEGARTDVRTQRMTDDRQAQLGRMMASARTPEERARIQGQMGGIAAANQAAFPGGQSMATKVVGRIPNPVAAGGRWLRDVNPYRGGVDWQRTREAVAPFVGAAGRGAAIGGGAGALAGAGVGAIPGAALAAPIEAGGAGAYWAGQELNRARDQQLASGEAASEMSGRYMQQLRDRASRGDEGAARQFQQYLRGQGLEAGLVGGGPQVRAGDVSGMRRMAALLDVADALDRSGRFAEADRITGSVMARIRSVEEG